MPSTRRTVAVSDAALAVESWGAGDPLLCLHGGMGLDSSYLKAPGILGLASDRQRVLVPDQRGHGRSSRCDPARYTHATWADDIVELCHGLRLERVALLGHSYGGFIALEVAVRRSDLLSHLILVGTSAGPVPGSTADPRTDSELRALIRARWSGFFAGEDKHWEVFERVEVSLAPFLAALHRELPRYDLRERLGAITAPTLLVVGETDPYLPDMRRLERAIKRSRLVVIPGAAHMPFLETPETFRDLVRGFLSSRA